jgi:hypothetical protein
MNLFRPAFLAAATICSIALLGLTRFYEHLPPQAVGMPVIGGTSVILLLHRFLPPFRASLDALSLEQLIPLVATWVFPDTSEFWCGTHLLGAFLYVIVMFTPNPYTNYFVVVCIRIQVPNTSGKIVSTQH